MEDRTLTLEDLKDILRMVAGTADGINSTADILDVGFDDLGYDSLALMEAGARVEHRYGIRLNDSTMVDARTPRELLAAINAHLAAVRAA